MMLNGCPREKEVKELVGRGQLSMIAATSPELAAHLRQCKRCADLALVMETFHRARADAAGPRNGDAPGLLWWQAQLRRRDAAMERISRPILGAQIFALVVNLAVAAGFVVWEATHGGDWVRWFEAQRQPGEIASFVAGAFSGWALLVSVPVVGTLVLLGGAAVYLAANDNK